MERTRYCSLDIETSGFDPLTNEILEVGFVLFEIADHRIKIIEEWTQVFKPAGPVSAQILGLTGISQQELEQAPVFAEYLDVIQEKIGNAVIVGHNISFDTKFLQAFGIKFSGPEVDTLDLVQFLLPTHHSYNLENLMHTFGIRHKEAHRALADSKAALKLLEKLLGLFASLPENLRQQIMELVSTPDFHWTEILSLKTEPLDFKKFFAKHNDISSLPILKLKFANRVVYNLPSGQDFIPCICHALKNSKHKYLIVVSRPQEVLELYRQGLSGSGLFLPEHQFDSKKFKALLKKKDLTVEEIKFILKILVWQETNWQTETILDLNLSFFGGQFKTLVTGGEIKDAKHSLLACDHATFLEMSKLGLLKDRQVLICGLNEFESGITKGLGTKTSWGYISYILKSYYNPEFGGQEKFKQPVMQALIDTDLFFGLVNALLQTDPPSFQYFKITPQVLNQEAYLKIKSAAENYCDKLAKINKVLDSELIVNFTKDLKGFFEDQENRVKWIELSESRCSFLSMPVEIKNLVAGILSPYENIAFADALGPEVLTKFFTQRLGIGDYKVKDLQYETTVVKKNSQQGDLFSSIKNMLAVKNPKISYHCLSKSFVEQEILQLLAHKNLPAAVLFPSVAGVKEFYDKNYQTLKQDASVLAQANSGGSNKIFRNFSINPKSILLATDKFILKHLNSIQAVEPINRLEVKTLVICRLPFEQFTHPYQEAISQSLPNAFMDYSLPKALFNFHSLVNFFYTPQLKDVYIIDAKLAKEYAGIFKEYYKFIPNCGIVD